MRAKSEASSDDSSIVFDQKDRTHYLYDFDSDEESSDDSEEYVPGTGLDVDSDYSGEDEELLDPSLRGKDKARAYKGREIQHETERISLNDMADESSTMKRNAQVVVGSIACIFLLAIIIPAVYIFWPRHSFDFDHTKVAVTVNDNSCISQYLCNANCTQIDVERGCCIGCNPSVPPGGACGLIVDVTWDNITSETIPQRVWIIASLDGRHYYTTGYAPYVLTNTTE
jgi:hypothetical protein